MYNVYWIKEVDMYSLEDGYIGISSRDPLIRFKEHGYRNDNPLLRNKIKKKDVEVIVLYSNLEVKDAMAIEEFLRPHEGIGWNLAKGGGVPPPRFGYQAPGTLKIGEDRSVNQKASSRKHSDRMKGKSSWNKGVATGGATPEARIKISIANKGRQKEIVMCPYCSKAGGKPAMIKWHFDNCKFKKSDH